MVKKIVILAETIDVDSSSAGKANMGFIHSLIKEGFKISVFHFSHKEVSIPEVAVTLIKENKTDIHYFLSRGQRVLQRITKKNFSRPLENRFGFSFTFKNDATSMAQALKGKAENADLIITLSKAASFRTHAALLKLPEFHKKWLAYVHDPYPFHFYPSPYNWKESGHQQKEDFFREVSIKAAYSGFPSALLMEWMGGFFPNFLKTGMVLPHQNILQNEAVAKPPLYLESNKFTLMHAGTLLDHRNPFPLLKAFELFLKNNPSAVEKIQLLLIGASGSHEPEFTIICDSIKAVYKSESYIPFVEVQSLQHHVSALLILEAVSDFSPFLPGKFPHYVNANKPILHLGPKNSETRRLLGEVYPYSCEADNVIGIASCIEKMYKQWKNNPKDFKLNRPDLEAYISSSFLAKQLTEALHT